MTITADRDARSLTRDARRPRQLLLRRRGQLSLGVALTLAFALLTAMLVMRAGGHTDVLRVTRAVPAGHRLTADDVDLVRVTAPSGVRLVSADQRTSLVGQTAVTNLAAGTLLAPEMLTVTPVPGPGETMVGLSLEPGDLPHELKAGDRVDVVAGGSLVGRDSVGGQVLASAALVFSVTPSSRLSGAILVSIVVAADRAPTVIDAARDKRLSLALLPPQAQP